MIDLIVGADSIDDLMYFAYMQGFIDANDDDFMERVGFKYCRWAGSGKMMIARGVYDGETEVTPPEYLPGIIMLVRIDDRFAYLNGEPDTIIPADDNPNKNLQSERSVIARFAVENGSVASTSGITYRELSGVRLYDPDSIYAHLEANDLPGHQWLEGVAP